MALWELLDPVLLWETLLVCCVFFSPLCGHQREDKLVALPTRFLPLHGSSEISPNLEKNKKDN